MLETPWVSLRRFARKNNTDTKELVKELNESSQKFSLWIISISLAAISLILSNLKDISEYISSYNLKVTLIFLFISVFCGIFYRVVFVFYWIYTDASFRILDYYFSEEKHMDVESSLDGSETIDDLIELNNQFRNTEGFKETFNQADDIGKAQVYNNLVAWYVKDVAWAKRNHDSTISDIAEINNKFLGVKKSSFFKPYSIWRLNLTKYLSVGLYFCFMLSFLFALAFFMFTINTHK